MKSYGNYSFFQKEGKHHRKLRSFLIFFFQKEVNLLIIIENCSLLSSFSSRKKEFIIENCNLLRFLRDI